MVLGAYGRSRLFEFTFGGVTRHLSKTADHPGPVVALKA